MKISMIVALACLVLHSGCVSTQMYTADGYLTEYGAKQTTAETSAIRARCSSVNQKIESKYFDCLRDVIPLMIRWGPELTDIVSQSISASRNVALGYEAGNISQDTTVEVLEQLEMDFWFQERIWREQYNRVIGARNAREQELARQRMGEALSRAGSELLRQSSSTRNKICNLPGNSSWNRSLLSVFKQMEQG